MELKETELKITLCVYSTALNSSGWGESWGGWWREEGGDGGGGRRERGGSSKGGGRREREEGE